MIRTEAIVGGLVVALIALVGIAAISGTSERSEFDRINCRYRETYSAAWIPLSTSVQDTWVTSHLASPAPPDWITAGETKSGLLSRSIACGSWGSVLASVRTLDMVLDNLDAPDDVRRQVALWIHDETGASTVGWEVDARLQSLSMTLAELDPDTTLDTTMVEHLLNAVPSIEALRETGEP